MILNIKSTRDHLQTLDYKTLFIEDLGWNRPPLLKPTPVNIHNTTYMLGEIAELAGVAVFEVRTTAAKGKIPDANTRKTIHREISRSYLENLLIFFDADNTQSLWYWVKRDGTKQYPL